jgi:hypothetical protein
MLKSSRSYFATKVPNLPLWLCDQRRNTEMAHPSVGVRDDIFGSCSTTERHQVELGVLMPKLPAGAVLGFVP